MYKYCLGDRYCNNCLVDMYGVHYRTYKCSSDCKSTYDGVVDEGDFEDKLVSILFELYGGIYTDEDLYCMGYEESELVARDCVLYLYGDVLDMVVGCNLEEARYIFDVGNVLDILSELEFGYVNRELGYNRLLSLMYDKLGCSNKCISHEMYESILESLELQLRLLYVIASIFN